MTSLKRSGDFLRCEKENGKKLVSLTAYDYPTAKLLDTCGLDFLLVGDSLGMVVLGYEDTTEVTMEEMLHHTRAVARGAAQTWVVADLPAGSYSTTSLAVQNSQRLLQAGANGVKMEGGQECSEVVGAILAEGIPVVGHLGMLPQRVRIEGGYRVKGRSPEEAARLMKDAVVLDKLGVSAIVLELVESTLASAISREIGCPTIGIGSGPQCDGQILVLHDVIGLFPWFRPRFAPQHADVAGEIQRAAGAFAASVRETKS